jgi:DHA1 family tetracycline resistance protein-like MFS transporter
MKLRRSIIPVLLTYFIDHFGFAIVFLLFGPLVLGQDLSIPISQPERPILALFAILIFPLAQSLGAPIFGALSDRIGRKKTFLISISGTIVGNAIMGSAFHWGGFTWVLIGRLLAGFFAGNLTLCLASLADMSHTLKHKVHNFSLLAAVGGVSYICAIVSGDLFARFSPSFPFWISAILGVFNITLLLIFFQETHKIKTSEPFGFWKIIKAIERLFDSRQLNLLYVCFFLFMMTWVPSLQFIPQHLTDQFDFSDQSILIFLTSLGVLWSGTNWLLSRYAPLFTSRVLYRLLLLLACFLAFAGTLPTSAFFISAFVVINIGAALTWTYLFVGISNQASMADQGEVLGVSQAIGSIAALTGLGLERYLTARFPDEYYLFAAGVMFLATLAAGLSRIKKNI